MCSLNTYGSIKTQVMITHVFEDINTGYSIITTVMNKNKLLDEGIITLWRTLSAMVLVYTTQD